MSENIDNAAAESGLAEKNVIESASATTSPDNQAGAGPVLLTAGVLILICALGMWLVQTFFSVGAEMADYYGETYAYEDSTLDDSGSGYGLLDEDVEELERLLDGSESLSSLGASDLLNGDAFENVAPRSTY
jgi:hypothetical protein